MHKPYFVVLGGEGFYNCFFSYFTLHKKVNNQIKTRLIFVLLKLEVKKVLIQG